MLPLTLFIAAFALALGQLPPRQRTTMVDFFRALANVSQATLQVVAPGIAEALIATAIGLFAAIPAVIAYNRFSARGEMLIGRYYTFADEFQAILHRKVHTSDD